MRALTPLRPTQAVSTLRDAIDDLFFSHFFGDAGGWLGQRFDGRFAPAVDTVVKNGADPRRISASPRRATIT